MAKLGYTWYPKDWGNSDSVFELTLIERGLYRELIDMAMLNDNKTILSLKLWARKFGSSEDEIEGILITLENLKLIEIKGDILFIPSCESRLNLVRGGSNGGKKSKPTPKPDSKPISKPTPKQRETKRENKIESKCLFKDSELFDKVKFKEAFPEWQRDKLAYYYEQALTWSNEGNKKIDWKATVRTWASRDEKEGKLKFASKNNNQIGGLVWAITLHYPKRYSKLRL